MMKPKEGGLVATVFPFVPVMRRMDGTMLRRDLGAAVSVALFTAPQGMAYALIAGMPPATGIWSSVIASILGAAFGSSEFLINGPTNAMSVLLAANAALFATHGDPTRMIALVTLVIGAGQLLAATARLGKFSRFVSEPVLSGFTAGAGIYIAVNQLPGALGLSRKALGLTIFGWTPPSNCVADFARVVVNVAHTNRTSLAVAGATFLLVRVLQHLEPRIGRRLPAPFAAVVALTIVSWALGLGDPSRGADKLRLVRDIEPIRRALPALRLPTGNLEDLRALVGPAFAIGLLGSVEALAIGKTLASRAGHAFDANRQLIGEGICNVGAALVGGFASSGSFTRSAVNFESGAATRMSCILSGVLVVVVLFAFAPGADLIPVAALAGTLIHVGVKLVNVSKLKNALNATYADRTVLLVTFVSVLVTEHLQYAVFIGIGVSIVSALRRAEGFKLVHLVEDGRLGLVERPLAKAALGEIVAIDLQGELFFAAADELETRLRAIFDGGTRYVVLRLAQSYNLDLTCAEAIEAVARRARDRGGRLILSGVRPGTRGTLERARVIERIGADAVFELEDELIGSTIRALEYAKKLAGRHIPLAHWP
ncbi:MAG TPA: SulP family inorganic anion transporter [Minicystis sp.]|nr:SulP family inorganic anion transporter [Minicystis sp.]